MNYPNLLLRSQLTKAIRDFFHKANFVEIDTPVRIPCPALEDYIDAIPASSFRGTDYFLRTSPELHLKRLLAQFAPDAPNLFQMGPCFREAEFGSRHREEFTMLEWYRPNADYRAILQDTIDLIRFIAQKTGKRTLHYNDCTIDLFQPWEELTVHDAFLKYTDRSVEQAIADGVYEELICEKIEPNLGRTVPTILLDYPASEAALARLKPENPTVAERWELYMGGLELANCYSELTDPEEQRARFEATAKLRADDGRAVYPMDEKFLQSLHQLPPTGGIALGVDRLCMVFAGTTDIADIQPF